MNRKMSSCCDLDAFREVFNKWKNRQNHHHKEWQFMACVWVRKRQKGHPSSFIGLARIILFKRFAKSSLIRYHIQQITGKKTDNERERERLNVENQANWKRNRITNMLTHSHTFINCGWIYVYIYSSLTNTHKSRNYEWPNQMAYQNVTKCTLHA